MKSPFYRAMGGPYRGKLLEFGESVLTHLPEVRKGSGNPAPKLADKWKSAVWLGKSVTDEHLVRTDEEVVYARSVRRLAEHSWSERNLRAEIPHAAEPPAPPPAAPEIPGDEKEEHTEKPENAGGAVRHKNDAWSFKLKQRRGAHRNTGSHFREDTVDDEVLDRKANSHNCRRACQTKTDW